MFERTNRTSFTSLAITMIALSSSFASFANAAPTGLTYQGRIVRPNGLPLESNSVSFIVRVASPGVEACTLYEETHTLNLTNSDGVFTIHVGSGSRSGADVGLSMPEVFMNSGVRTGLNCASGSTYSPASGDTRKMYVSFNDGSGLVSFSSPYVIRSVPYAFESDAVGGYQAANLCRVDDGGVPQSVSPLTSANFNELMSLVSGTSAQYSRNSAGAGTSLSVISGNPPSPAEGSIWLDSATGSLKFQDATSTRTLGTSGGSVMSVVGGVGLNGGAITTTGTLSVDVGTGANKIVQLNSSAELPAVSGANLTGLTADQISSGTFAVARLPLSGVAASTYRSVTVDTTGRVTAGSNPTTLAGYGITDAVRAGGQSGALVLGTTDASTLTFNTSGAGRISILASGDVGVGTTTPVTKLDIAGTIRIGDGGETCAVGLAGALRWSSSQVQYCNGTTWAAFPVNGADNLGNHTATQNVSMGSFSLLNLNTGSSASPSVSFDGDSDTGFYRPSANTVAIATAATERLRINSSGDVGLGTTSPVTKLDVAGTIRIGNSGETCAAGLAGAIRWNSGQIEFCSGTAWATIASDGNDNLGNHTATQNLSMGSFSLLNLNTGSSAAPSVSFNSDAGTGFYRVGSGQIGFTTGGTKRWEINSTAFEGAGSLGAKIRSTGGGASTATYSFNGDNGSGMYSPNTNELALSSNGVERIRVGSNGNVGIGTGTPTQKLEVAGGIKIAPTGARPTCDATTRGTFWMTQGGTGVKDTIDVCTKDLFNAYAWRPIVTE